MRFRNRLWAGLCALIALAAVGVSTVPVDAAGQNGNGSSLKSKGPDTDPHIPMPAWMMAGYNAKQAQANNFYATYFGSSNSSPKIAQCVSVAGNVASPEASTLCSPPVSLDLPGNQMTQQANTWCGPAAMTEVLLGLGVNSGGVTISMSQPTAASLLKTQPYDNDSDDGTAWSGINAGVPSPTGHPMLDVYNYEYYGTTAGYMYQIAVPYPYTSTVLTNYKSNLTWDVYDGFPLIGDAWEEPGGYYLVGHPTNIEILHWFKIRGYYSSGSGTDYEDSESGAESLSGWKVGSVPKYSSYDTGHLLLILGGRGYIW